MSYILQKTGRKQIVFSKNHHVQHYLVSARGQQYLHRLDKKIHGGPWRACIPCVDSTWMTRRYMVEKLKKEA